MSSGSATRARVRLWWPIGALLVAVVAIGLVAGPPDEGLPLDPTSTGPNGTRAVVETLERLDARVTVTDAPPAEADTVLVLSEASLSADQLDALERWIEAGGVAVIADPLSRLAPEAVGATAELLGQVPLRRQCDEPALAGVDLVAPGGSSLVFELPEGAVGCFASGRGHWFVAAPRGEGSVVALGGPEIFTNAQLAEADNAVLAANLLTPVRGSHVVLLRPPRPGEGDDTLGDLIAPGVRTAGWQLAIAFGVFAAWRAWRLGRPIEEPQPVSVGGSELVVAVGNLLQEAEARDRAVALLRQDVRRVLGERLGVPRDLAVDELAGAVQARTGVPRARVLAVLTAAAPNDDAGLLQQAQAAERLRADVLAPVGARSTDDADDKEQQ